jgi:hypothetical protein
MTLEPDSLKESGRNADPDEMILRLATAPHAYLAGALENPALTIRHVAILLRNRGADESMIQSIGSDPRWTQTYEVKKAIVRHPKAPNAMALTLVRHLLWKDLAGVAGDPFLFPPLRRLAERILGEKLGDMALGEKISLARSSGRGLIAKFLDDANPKVLEAALWNGKVTSSDVLTCAARPTSRPVILEAITRHPRWNTRRDVRLALLRNPGTPVAAGISLLSGLGQADIRALAELPDTPRALKLACARMLRGRS